MRDRESQECSKLLKLVADPERLRIVQCLRRGPRSVGELAGELKQPLQNTSHHLKLLRKSGLVKSSKTGRFVIYSLAPRYAPAKAKSRLDVLDFGCCRLDFGEG